MQGLVRIDGFRDLRGLPLGWKTKQSLTLIMNQSAVAYGFGFKFVFFFSWCKSIRRTSEYGREPRLKLVVCFVMGEQQHLSWTRTLRVKTASITSIWYQINRIFYSTRMANKKHAPSSSTAKEFIYLTYSNGHNLRSVSPSARPCMKYIRNIRRMIYTGCLYLGLHSNWGRLERSGKPRSQNIEVIHVVHSRFSPVSTSSKPLNARFIPALNPEHAPPRNQCSILRSYGWDNRIWHQTKCTNNILIYTTRVCIFSLFDLI